MNYPRQLLFALLALQNEFITQEQLLKAFDLWLADKSRSLEEILVEQGALTIDDRSLFDRLVEKHLERFGGDAQMSLTNLSGITSIADALRASADGDSDALQTVSFLHRSPPEPSDATTIQGDSQKPTIRVQVPAEDRFRIVKEHAKGGLGVVFVAEDRHLKREVALKQIRKDHADDDLFRQKFVQEAEVTGQLEHPGIVPVYALGTDTNGRPYYAMRFIRGEDLQSRIENFHKDLVAKKHAYDGPELRSLLRRFIDVCNAIDYAHDRGVLHRDLKPGNVMLGKHGETLVVDWGLAKPIGQKLGSDENASQASSELPVPQNESNDSATQQGVFRGTALYAPPEQLKGELHLLCPASDVYSLGAILYELLCGKRPVEGKNRAEIIKQIESGSVVNPCSRIPHIPKPLNSICRKAIAPTIDSRYPSASALRTEIEAWLNDTPVQAHRDSIVERISRWSRNHKTLVATLSAAGLVVVLALVALTVLQRRANQQISSQRDIAKLLAANTLLDKGFKLASEGRITNGILHMGASLKESPDGETNLEEVIRKNISAWTANTQHSLGGIDIAGSASRVVAVSDDGQYAATVVGDEKSNRVIAVLQCLPRLQELKRITLDEFIGSLAFASDGKLIASSADRLFAIDIQNGTSELLTTLPSMATAITIGSTGRIWLGCEQGEIGTVERSKPKWMQVRNCRGSVVQIGVAQREDRVIACTDQKIVYVIDRDGRELSSPFTAGIGDSYAVDADHGYLAASVGAEDFAPFINFWGINGQPLPISLQKTNSVNSIEIVPSRNQLIIACKDLVVDTQSTFDWSYIQDQYTPLAALTSRTARDSNVSVTNSIGKSGTWVSATQFSPYEKSIVQSSLTQPYCSIDLGEESLWGGNANQIDVLSNTSMKVLTSLPIPHPTTQLHRFEDYIVAAGLNGISILDARDLTLARDSQQPFPIARRGVVSSLDSQKGMIVSNIAKSKELRSFSFSDLTSNAGPDTQGWFCYGIAISAIHEMLLLGLHDGTIRAIDGRQQEVGRTNVPTDAEIMDIAVNNEQTRVVAITRLGTLFAYSLPKLEFLTRVEASDGRYPTLKFSQNGHWLLSGFGRSQLRHSHSMLPVGPPKGCLLGPNSEKVDCFIGNGFATASQATSGIGYIDWTPNIPAWRAAKDQTFAILSRRLGNTLKLDGAPIENGSPLSLQELDEWFPRPSMPLPTADTFPSWRILREKYGKWHFEPKHERLLHDRLAKRITAVERQPDIATAEGMQMSGANGHKLLELDASESVQLGSPPDEIGRLPNETHHPRSLKLKKLAMGLHEVTVEQFSAFRNAYANASSRSKQLPATDISWYEAAAYCNWLSEQEGLDKDQWCYLPSVSGEYGPGMRIANDWWRRKGYRLPTESEWEFACRAGTLTARPCGDSLDGVDDCCWTSRNAGDRLHPVGQKQKNPFGLFDMLGNASEWCHTSHEIISTFTREPSVVGEFPGPVSNTRARSVRGGSALEFHGNARSAFRDYYTPDTRLPCLGFRICRTIASELDDVVNDLKLAPADLLPFVGQFQYPSGIMTTSVENGQLFGQLAKQPKIPIFPIGENRFQSRGVKAEIEFMKDDQGVVIRARHTQNGSTFDAPKLK